MLDNKTRNRTEGFQEVNSASISCFGVFSLTVLRGIQESKKRTFLNVSYRKIKCSSNIIKIQHKNKIEYLNNCGNRLLGISNDLHCLGACASEDTFKTHNAHAINHVTCQTKRNCFGSW